MAFESKVLKLAESVGIDGAYFTYSSLFIPFSSVSLPGMLELKKFLALYSEIFPGKPMVTLGDEVFRVDFAA